MVVQVAFAGLNPRRNLLLENLALQHQLLVLRLTHLSGGKFRIKRVSEEKRVTIGHHLVIHQHSKEADASPLRLLLIGICFLTLREDSPCIPEFFSVSGITMMFSRGLPFRCLRTHPVTGAAPVVLAPAVLGLAGWLVGVGMTLPGAWIAAADLDAVRLVQVVGTAGSVGAGSAVGYPDVAKFDEHSRTSTLPFSVSASAKKLWKIPILMGGVQPIGVGSGSAAAEFNYTGSETNVSGLTLNISCSTTAGASIPPSLPPLFGVEGSAGGNMEAILRVSRPVLARVSLQGTGAIDLYPWSQGQPLWVHLAPGVPYWQGRLDSSRDFRVQLNVEASSRLAPIAFIPKGAAATATVTFSELPVVNLRAIEVTQTIQDWNHSVPLVAGKRTLARVFLEKSSSAAKPLTVGGQLRIQSNGITVALVGPINSDGKVLVSSANATSDKVRSDGAATLNFFIPTVLAQGSLNLSFEPSDAELTCNSTGATQGCETTVSFVPAPNLAVKFLKLGDPDGTDFPKPSDEDIQTHAAAVREWFPVSELGYEISNFDARLQELDSLDVLVDKLARRHREANDPRFAASYGLYADYQALVQGQGVGGVSDRIPGSAAAGKAADTATTLHELGHLFGLHHTIDRALGQDQYGQWQGYCNEIADPPAETFPYFYEERKGLKTPTLGPLNSGTRSLVYGWRLTDPNSGGPRIQSPFEASDLMSYCAGRFPSKFTYESILARLKSLSSKPLAGSRRTRLDFDPTTGPWLGVHGWIDLQSKQVTWLPFGGVTSLLDAGSVDAAGEYQLRVEGAGGELLAELPFTPRPAIDGTISRAFFSLYVPASPPANRVTILRQGFALGERTASAHAPKVDVLTPNGGEGIDDAPVQVTWSASDSDGDPLFFDVAFSRDDGTSWETLAMAITGTSLRVPADSLRGTLQGRFRVAVSDGFRSAEDLSDGPFRVANRPPSLVITLPAAGAKFTGAQMIPLAALTYDPEAGSTALTNVVWKSDRDGILGTGLEITRRANQLSVGSHRLTATITDDQGLTNQVTRQIEIQSIPSPTLFEAAQPDSESMEVKSLALPASLLVIERSSNLVTWSEAVRVVQSNSVEALTLPAETGSVFLRARSEPLPPPAPAFIEPVTNVTAVVGAPAFLSAAVAGGELMSAQWYFNGNLLPGATNLALLLDAVAMTHAGSYYLVASNASGARVSSNIVLDVLSSAFAPLHAFGTVAADGVNPWGPLTVGLDDWVYGCTRSGGLADAGVIFKINPANGEYRVLRRLSAALDGSVPLGGVIQLANGDLYGTTSAGGAFSAGTVFKIGPDGSGFAVLRHLQASGDCRNPQAPLLQGRDGLLYGTAFNGGGFGRGGVFRIGPDGSNYSILTGFNVASEIPRQPIAGLLEGPDGAFYGCTEWGGEVDKGTVFRVTTNGAVTVLKSFGLVAGGAEQPNGELLLASDNRLYGTAALGGTAGFGCLFRLELDGRAFDILRSFGITANDVREPRTGLVETPFGALLGTTRFGGIASQGGVFQFNLDGLGYGLPHQFANTADNGARARSPLVAGGRGTYYGATFGGGPTDQGVVFRLFISDFGP
jgi:uncharacterized repeat protein (TIGR03803 family)